MNIFSRLRAVTLLLLLCASAALAGTWDKPAADLAKAIAGVTGPGTISLSIRNISSLPKDQLPEIQRALEAQLRTSGVRVGGTPSGNIDIRVTLSENQKSFVWVAEIRRGGESHVEMLAVPREQLAVSAKSGPSVTLQKILLFAQHVPILDAYVLDATSPNPRLFVLDAENLAMYTISANTWQRQQAWAITHNHVFPRDVRGLLVPNQNRAVDVYLPGTVCEASTQALICRDGDDPWKIGPRAAFFNSARNYFTGATVPANPVPGSPFYSAAWVQHGTSAWALFMGVDGRLRLNDGSTERPVALAATNDWGSDIAAVKSGCGSGVQLLVSGAGDGTQSDSLRAFDFADRDPVLVSQSLEFPGPITALWSHDTNGAVTIAHNLHNGNYEAYSVSITCNQ